MSESAANSRNRCTSQIVIPARLASTRLPRKLLLRETGKSLIQHTYEAALRAKRPEGVCVAADHDEIRREVEQFGGNVKMTDPNAASGTDRVAELAERMDCDIIVNMQGDEPELAGEAVDLAVSLLEENPDAVMATLAAPIRSREQLNDPACVKVVFDHAGRAMYFSRSPIPHPRQWDDGLLDADPAAFYQHIGLYAYRREFLLKLSQIPQSSLEKIESLEQLRVIQGGHAILVGVIEHAAVGIDTAEDYGAFVQRCAAG